VASNAIVSETKSGRPPNAVTKMRSPSGLAIARENMLVPGAASFDIHFRDPLDASYATVTVAEKHVSITGSHPMVMLPVT